MLGLQRHAPQLPSSKVSIFFAEGCEAPHPLSFASQSKIPCCPINELRILLFLLPSTRDADDQRRTIALSVGLESMNDSYTLCEDAGRQAFLLLDVASNYQNSSFNSMPKTRFGLTGPSQQRFRIVPCIAPGPIRNGARTSPEGRRSSRGLRCGPSPSWSLPGRRSSPRSQPAGRRVVANFWQNFGKMLLVFGCIGTDFCK